MSGRTTSARYAAPLGVSAALHASLLAAFVLSRPAPPLNLPPVYRVNIVAAPPGPRAIGEVTPEPAPAKPAPTPAKPPPAPAKAAPPKPAPPKPAPKVAPAKERVAPIKPPTRQTPPARTTPVPQTTPVTPPKSTPKPQPAPRAGGGPTGGRGADVATVRTEGIDFPYQGYLDNIVRQIAINFKPPNPALPLSALVAFNIHRDGSVTDVRFVKRSGSLPFDLEAQGAIEAAARARAFGALPEGFSGDILPVIFSFDPSVLR